MHVNRSNPLRKLCLLPWIDFDHPRSIEIATIQNTIGSIFFIRIPEQKLTKDVTEVHALCIFLPVGVFICETTHSEVSVQMLSICDSATKEVKNLKFRTLTANDFLLVLQLHCMKLKSETLFWSFSNILVLKSLGWLIGVSIIRAFEA